MIRRLKLPMHAVEQRFRRMIFDVVARNQDDHVKNIAFLMDQQGNWSLSPAFDVTYAYNPDGRRTKQHQMTINGKRDAFTLDDFRACAAIAGLKRGRTDRILDELRAVVVRWPLYAEQAQLRPSQRDSIRSTFVLDFRPGPR